MPASIAVLFAEGFEEIEAITIVDVLRRARLDAVMVAVSGTGAAGPVTGAHGITVQTDIALDQALSRAWDMVVLPGGMPGSTHLRDHPGVARLVRAQNEAGGRIGAICAAPIALGAFGVLAGKRATSYPGFEPQLTGARCVEEPCVRDGNVLTSRGVGTALDFALEIVADLAGRDQSDLHRERMLVGSRRP